MPDKPSDRGKAGGATTDRVLVQAEWSAAVEEYKALKAEIVSNLTSARQVTTLTLTAAAALVALATQLYQSQSWIFVAAPLGFYALAWVQLRYTYLVRDMGDYLRDELRPVMRRILSEKARTARLPDGTNASAFEWVLGWELSGKGPSRLREGKWRRRAFMPIAGANFAIPLVAAFASAVTYFVVGTRPSTTQETVAIAVFLILDAIGFVYSAYWGLEAESSR